MVQPNLSLDQSPFPKQLRVEPLMGQPNPSLDHSPFPKQLGIPVSSTTGPRPHTINNAESTRQYSSPLLPCHNPRSPEPELDIKAALSAQGIHIGIPLSTPHLQSPTDQVEPRLHVNKHTLPTGPTPPTPAALMSPHVDDPCVQKESPRPLRDNPDVKMRALSGPNAPPEPPKRPPGLQSPAVRSGTLVPALSVRVSLPPPSKAKVVANLLGLSGKPISNQSCRK
ncbi:uncharacterized protein EDB91DRAFT_466050 [Suillus paluster]|uniref:uncharacterized protein n=1 Tax=Suillus paluster TaxID=48578 RepID=UPI001B876F5D|nr:uncharacterized protein EDB91DRAFT_466050 [Suillus paluster]KAG1738130.1 hypothetical protein EDB91DRAFT_466050 [Suillus paluster]